MISERVLSLISKVVTTISLKKILTWALAALVCIVSFTVYENRDAVTNLAVHGRSSSYSQTTVTFKVTDLSKSRVKAMTTDDAVAAIVVMNADIRNNRRIPVYWYAPDQSIQTKLTELFSDRFGGFPLFTSDEKNNENVVGVINGEFSCAPYDKGYEAVYPSMAHRFPFICQTSLPPYYGAFSGYITVALNRAPLPAELDALKIETLNLSTDIYFRDILPANKFGAYK